MMSNLKRIMIVGTNSGCGKTTVTCAVLRALVNRKVKTAAFKCGPDYIDPMFHSEIIGTRSGNLDPFLCGEETMKALFVQNGAECEISIVEGVMGFYDGMGAKSNKYSSCDISVMTNTSAVLVVNAKGASLSVCALIKGFMDFMPNKLCGVILNGCSAGMYPVYKEMIKRYTGLSVYGFLPYLPQAALESRHLGLITAAEVDNLREKTDMLAEAAEQYIDLNGLLRLGALAQPIETTPISVKKEGSCRIAVAMDKAFCFYYQDGLDILKKMGAELVPFSPLHDRELPENIHGLYLGGGYPELYLKELSENESMRRAVGELLKHGLPAVCECGGFMYLHEGIETEDGTVFPMTGIVKGRAHLTKKLQRFGYVTLHAQQSSLLFEAGMEYAAHEFHYSDSDNAGEDLLAVKPMTGRKWNCAHTSNILYAGYPHLHFCGNQAAAARFVRACCAYSREGLR